MDRSTDVLFQAVSNPERATRGTSKRTASMSPDERCAPTVELGAAQFRQAVELARDLGRGAGAPTFFDYEHTNELGAELVARRIYESIKPQLVARSTGR